MVGPIVDGGCSIKMINAAQLDLSRIITENQATKKGESPASFRLALWILIQNQFAVLLDIKHSEILQLCRYTQYQ